MSSLLNIVVKYQIIEHNCNMVNKSSRGYHFALILCIAVMVSRPFVVFLFEEMSMLILYAVHSLASSEFSDRIFGSLN